MVQTILGVSLTLEEIPEAFRHDYFRGYSGPQPFHSRSARLLNRQVKVAFSLAYKSGLQQVLEGFQNLVNTPESWTSCLFVSICLAFLLENIETASRGYLYFASKVYKDDPGSMSAIEDYCREVDVIVFDRIYRLLSTMLSGGRSTSSFMDLKLLISLKQIRQEFRKFLYMVYPQTRSNLCCNR